MVKYIRILVLFAAEFSVQSGGILMKAGKIEQVGKSEEILNRTITKIECYKMRKSESI